MINSFKTDWNKSIDKSYTATACERFVRNSQNAVCEQVRQYYSDIQYTVCVCVIRTRFLAQNRIGGDCLQSKLQKYIFCGAKDIWFATERVRNVRLGKHLTRNNNNIVVLCDWNRIEVKMQAHNGSREPECTWRRVGFVTTHFASTLKESKLWVCVSCDSWLS